MAEFTAVGLNCHNNRKAVRYLRRRSGPRHPDHFELAAVFEVQKRRHMLNGFGNHDYYTGEPGVSAEDMARSTGLLLADSLPLLAHSTEFISSKTKAFEKVGKERWGHELVTRFGRAEIALLGLHPVAWRDHLNDAGNVGSPLVARYRNAMQWLDDRLTYHIDVRQRHVVVLSDIQMAERDPVPWNPRHVFRAHGMGTYWNGIDVAAWSSGLRKLKAWADESAPTDHPAIWARLAL